MPKRFPQDHGIRGPMTLLGHCIHINTAEMDIIRETGTMCVNNPQSNMGNGVGCSPVLQLLKRGITVGLGTDAYTNDVLESAKTRTFPLQMVVWHWRPVMPKSIWPSMFSSEKGV